MCLVCKTLDRFTSGKKEGDQFWYTSHLNIFHSDKELEASSFNPHVLKQDLLALLRRYTDHWENAGIDEEECQGQNVLCYYVRFPQLPFSEFLLDKAKEKVALMEQAPTFAKDLVVCDNYETFPFAHFELRVGGSTTNCN